MKGKENKNPRIRVKMDSKEFGDLQLHLEFSLPTTPGRIGSEASSIGVLLQGRYEILLKNSYGRPPNTECSGALLGNHPPCVNAMLPSPGWQTLDVYQNLSITYLSSIIKNQELNKNIFYLPN